MNCLMTAWHEHGTELRGWLRHRLGSAADAEDLLQDVFLKAMRQGERFCVSQTPVAERICVPQGAESPGVQSRVQHASGYAPSSHKHVRCAWMYPGLGGFVPRQPPV